MSRKKNLSVAASLASCLDFAARVLASTATVQEVCTKPILAPMVVEAHRYGQQVMKHLEPGAPAEVRKLLRILQGDHNTKLRRESPLTRLDVADLTWDFEGSVAHTLEMELKELKERAATSTADTCVVLSTSSPLAGGGHAVIWFPQEIDQRRRDEGDPRNVTKKPQYLLYVCPGRVKVIKSVGGLIKKLYDELPILQENDATYNVWAVTMDTSRARNQQQMSPVKKHQTKGNQHDDGSLPSGLGATSSVALALSADNVQLPQLPCTESPDSFDGENNQDADENFVNVLTDVVSELHDRESDPDNLLSVSPRVSVNHASGDSMQSPSKSIFSFGLRSQEMQRRLSAQERRDLEGVETEVVGGSNMLSEITETENCAGTDDEATSPPYNQCLDKRSRRGIVSASLADFSTTGKQMCLMMEASDLDMGFHLQEGFVWQSCDGKVLRRSVHPQRRTSADDKSKASSFVAAGASCEDSAEQNEVQDQSDDEVHDEFQDEGHVNVQVDVVHEGDDEVRDNGNEMLRSSEEHKPQCESREQLPRQTYYKLTRPTEDNIASNPLIFTFGNAPTPYPADDWTQPSADLPQMFSPRTIAAAHLPSDLERTGARQNMEITLIESTRESEEKECFSASFIGPSGLLDLPAESDKDVSVCKPKPSTVNYKDKLGAQVWWELEYTARRLELEERLECQQTRYYQRNTFVRGCQRPTDNIAGSRRMEPTGWSKQEQRVQRKAIAIGNVKNVDLQLSSGTGTVAVPEQPDKQKCADVVSASSLLTEELRSLKVETRRSYGEQSADKMEEQASPRKRSPPSGGRESLNNGMDIAAKTKLIIKQVVSAHPSSSERLSCGDYSPPSTMSLQEDNSFNAVVVVIPETLEPPSAVSLFESRGRDQGGSYGGKSPFSASIVESAVRPASTTSSFAQRHNSREAEIAKTDNQVEEEDETLEQIMWGSTHTSYERGRSACGQTKAQKDELPTTEIASTVPFTLRGRVPMRARQSSSRVIVPAIDESSFLCRTEHSRYSYASDCDSTEASHHVEKPSPRVGSSRHRASICLQANTVAPRLTPVATFIALGDDNASSHTAASTRHERLNELRQKKLHKLQQTRDVSILQQKEKQLQRQAHRPLSFASSVYTKKASNRQLIQNAVGFTLLAGGSMDKERTLALQALAESTSDNFVVLLKSAKELKFRALYENHVDRDYATRIFSVLPSNSARAPLKIGSSEMISQFFKYSSAKKQFLPVSTRSFTVKTDACALVDQLVFKGKSKSGTSALARLL